MKTSSSASRASEGFAMDGFAPVWKFWINGWISLSHDDKEIGKKSRASFHVSARYQANMAYAKGSIEFATFLEAVSGRRGRNSIIVIKRGVKKMMKTKTFASLERTTHTNAQNEGIQVIPADVAKYREDMRIRRP